MSAREERGAAPVLLAGPACLRGPCERKGEGSMALLALGCGLIGLRPKREKERGEFLFFSPNPLLFCFQNQIQM